MVSARRRAAGLLLVALSVPLAAADGSSPTLSFSLATEPDLVRIGEPFRPVIVVEGTGRAVATLELDGASETIPADGPGRVLLAPRTLHDHEARNAVLTTAEGAWLSRSIRAASTNVERAHHTGETALRVEPADARPGDVVAATLLMPPEDRLSPAWAELMLGERVVERVALDADSSLARIVRFSPVVLDDARVTARLDDGRAFALQLASPPSPPQVEDVRATTARFTRGLPDDVIQVSWRLPQGIDDGLLVRVEQRAPGGAWTEVGLWSATEEDVWLRGYALDERIELRVTTLHEGGEAEPVTTRARLPGPPELHVEAQEHRSAARRYSQGSSTIVWFVMDPSGLVITPLTGYEVVRARPDGSWEVVERFAPGEALVHVARHLRAPTSETYALVARNEHGAGEPEGVVVVEGSTPSVRASARWVLLAFGVALPILAALERWRRSRR